MDAIQKTLIEAGRKDLAQKYFERTSAKDAANKNNADKDYKIKIKDIDKEMSKFHKLLDKHKKNQLKDTDNYGFAAELGKVFESLVDINDFLK